MVALERGLQMSIEAGQRGPWLTRRRAGALLAAFAVAAPVWGCGKGERQTNPVPGETAPAFDHADLPTIDEHLAHLEPGTYVYSNAPDAISERRSLFFCLSKKVSIRVTERQFEPRASDGLVTSSLTVRFRNYPDCLDDGKANSRSQQPPEEPESLSPLPDGSINSQFALATR